ncbi:MAG: CGNR zinc finger domain-containing protein [Acidimicrobiales bacterium]
MEPAALDPGDYTGTYKFVGSRLSLDLVNTVSWPEHDRRHDWLDRYPNLIAWATEAGMVKRRQAARLLAIGHADDDRAGRVLANVRRQRAVLRDVFSPIVQGHSPSTATIDALNELIGPAAARRRVSRRPLGWTWLPVEEPEHLTTPVIFDAADLFVAGDHSRLGLCPACGWLYYDTTRNRSRRWCDMADCGSRDKARAHYHRHRER